MSQPFDPYRKWLGISPDEQPPTHYRLLGLREFEAEADVIEHAADRQMLHLRSLQAGPHAAISQRLLNEVSAARVCLLDAAKKQAYDAELRARRAAAKPAPAPQAPAAQAPVAQTPVALAPIAPAPPAPSGLPAASAAFTAPIAAPGPTYVAPRAPAPAARAPSTIPLALLAAAVGGGALLVLACVVGVWMAFAGRADDDLASAGDSRSDSTSGARAAQVPPAAEQSAAVRPTGETPADQAATSGELPPKTIDPIPAFAPVASQRDIDLLALTLPQEHTVWPDWTKENGVLRCQAKNVHARVFAPHAPPAEYRVRARVQRLAGGGVLVIGLVCGDRHAVVVVDAQAGKATRLEGARPADSAKKAPPPAAMASHAQSLLPLGTAVTLTCEVRPGRVAAAADGQTLFDWNGDFAELAAPDDWRLDVPGALYLGAGSDFEILEFALTPLGADVGRPLGLPPVALVAEAEHFVAGMGAPRKYFSSGRLDFPWGLRRWRQEGNKLWMEGEVRRENLTLADDGLSYSGRNGAGRLVRGRVTQGGFSLVPGPAPTAVAGRQPIAPSPMPARADVERELAALASGQKLDELASSADRQRVALALFDEARKAPTADAAQCARLEASRRLALLAEDWNLWINVLDALRQSFGHDALPEQTEALVAAIADEAASARGAAGAKNGDARLLALAEATAHVVKSAQARHEHDRAAELARALLAASEGRGAGEWRRGVQQLAADAELAQAAWSRHRRAAEALAVASEDAAAQQVAGDWHCLFEGDWAKGLPRWAAGTDVELRAAASADIRAADAPPDAAAQRQVADQWWALALARQDRPQAALRERAAHWYALCEPRTADAKLLAEIRQKRETTLKAPFTPLAGARRQPALPPARPYIPLTELTPLQAQVGWDDFRVNSAHESTWPLELREFDGKFCDEFLFTHAPARLAYNLPAGVKSLTCDGYCVKSRDVRFQVRVDGVLLYSSELAGLAAIRLDLPAKGKVLELVADDNGDFTNDWSYWRRPRLHRKTLAELGADPRADASAVKLTGLRPVAFKVGWGEPLVNRVPEKVSIPPLDIDSFALCREFLKAHAASRLTYEIPPGAAAFSALGENLVSESAKFQVYADEQPLYDSGQVPLAPIQVNLPEGAKLLTLVVDDLGNNQWDQAFWCRPRFHFKRFEKAK